MNVLSHFYQTLTWLPGLLIGLTVHEFSHAWSSSLLGDDYARRQGRVSLNPLRHLTFLGTLAILLLPFGWGRPVPVNLYNYRNPKRDYLLSSLAGPASNLLLAGLGLALMQLTRHTYALGEAAGLWMMRAHLLLMGLVLINAALAALNLIPIPPLDGSKIWPCLLGRNASFTAKSSRWMILIVVALFAGGVLKPVIRTAVDGVGRLMPTTDGQVFVDRYEAAVKAYDAGHYAQAEALLDEDLSIDPRSDKVLASRADVRWARHHWQPALDDISAAIRLCPDKAEYYRRRAMIHIPLGQAKEIQEDMETYKRLGGKF
jgi:Zn-dependent protease